MAENHYTIAFSKITARDVATVGGKNASLGEMIGNLSQYHIRIPDGFATTAEAYRFFLKENNLEGPLSKKLATLDTKTFSNLDKIADSTRRLHSIRMRY